MRDVIESAVVFGRFNGLIGIVSDRVQGSVSEERADGRNVPAVIILNTGTIHRVGAARLSTIWARRIANSGHCVLRFDLSGIGDSERREDSLAPTDVGLSDLRDALDWLDSARGIRRVILIGNCSGADLSLLYAGTDDRVVGMVIIDPTTPPTRLHYLRKCVSPQVWKKKLGAGLRRLSIQRTAPREEMPNDVWKANILSLDDPRVHAAFADAYRAAFARQVRTLAIFTTGADWYNYRRQLVDAFPEIDFEGNLQLEYFRRCDHTITHEANRIRLFEVVDRWMAQTEFRLLMLTPETGQQSAKAGEHSNDPVRVEF